MPAVHAVHAVADTIAAATLLHRHNAKQVTGSCCDARGGYEQALTGQHV